MNNTPAKRSDSCRVSRLKKATCCLRVLASRECLLCLLCLLGLLGFAALAVWDVILSLRVRNNTADSSIAKSRYSRFTIRDLIPDSRFQSDAAEPCVRFVVGDLRPFFQCKRHPYLVHHHHYHHPRSPCLGLHSSLFSLITSCFILAHCSHYTSYSAKGRRIFQL